MEGNRGPASSARRRPDDFASGSWAAARRRRERAFAQARQWLEARGQPCSRPTPPSCRRHGRTRVSKEDPPNACGLIVVLAATALIGMARAWPAPARTCRLPGSISAASARPRSRSTISTRRSRGARRHRTDRRTDDASRQGAARRNAPADELVLNDVVICQGRAHHRAVGLHRQRSCHAGPR